MMPDKTGNFRRAVYMAKEEYYADAKEFLQVMDEFISRAWNLFEYWDDVDTPENKYDVRQYFDKKGKGDLYDLIELLEINLMELPPEIRRR